MVGLPRLGPRRAERPRRRRCVPRAVPARVRREDAAGSRRRLGPRRKAARERRAWARCHPRAERSERPAPRDRAGALHGAAAAERRSRVHVCRRRCEPRARPGPVPLPVLGADEADRRSDPPLRARDDSARRHALVGGRRDRCAAARRLPACGAARQAVSLGDAVERRLRVHPLAALSIDAVTTCSGAGRRSRCSGRST